MSSFSIDPHTVLGPVELAVADLPRAIDFYSKIIGLQPLHESEQSVWLGVDRGEALVVLTAQPGAQPKPPRTTGLYHFAILTPSRLDLARSLQRLNDVGYPLQGASDHLVSEALYLADPEGNGIEIYADRPRDAWQYRDGELVLATVPLNLESLRQELRSNSEPWQGLAAGTHIGHVHLHVADLVAAEAFYRDVLGFDLVSRYGPSASFVSAGGYHHHIGMNTWSGVGAPTPPRAAVGLRRFTIRLPDQAAQRALRDHLTETGALFSEQNGGISLTDPSNNGIFVTAEPAFVAQP